jgi:endonuclease/exonuclease/phosphatase family metal-dependent hydrolase
MTGRIWLQIPFLVDRSVQALETAELVSRLEKNHVVVLAGDFNSAPGE